VQKWWLKMAALGGFWPVQTIPAVHLQSLFLRVYVVPRKGAAGKLLRERLAEGNPFSAVQTILGADLQPGIGRFQFRVLSVGIPTWRRKPPRQRDRSFSAPDVKKVSLKKNLWQ